MVKEEEFPKALTLFSVVHIDLLKNTAFNKRPYSPEMHSNSKQVEQSANVWDFMCFSVTSYIAVSQLRTLYLKLMLKLHKLIAVILKYGDVQT